MSNTLTLAAAECAGKTIKSTACLTFHELVRGVSYSAVGPEGGPGSGGRLACGGVSLRHARPGARFWGGAVPQRRLHCKAGATLFLHNVSVRPGDFLAFGSILRGKDGFRQRAVLDRVQAVCSDPGPAGGAETLGLQPEANQVIDAAKLREMQEVRDCHVVPQDVVHSLGQPGSSLLGLIVDTRMTWNIKGTEQLKLSFKQKLKT